MSLAQLSHPTTDARTRILDAAEAIVRARGVPGLTLEAAAREAGVSKGGLLYHFGSKEQLVVEVLSPSTRQIDRLRKLEEYKRLSTLTYILLVEPDLRREWDEIDRRFGRR